MARRAPLKKKLFQPDSISAIAEAAFEGLGNLGPMTTAFVDSFFDKPEISKLEQEPRLLEDPVQNVYLAAMTEQLARRNGLEPPQWTESPSRFLEEPYCYSGLKPLKEHLLRESPLPFRRRNLILDF